MIKYSPSNHACYLEGLNYPNIPSDVVDITSDEHKIFTGETNPDEGMRLVKNEYPFTYENDPEYISPLELARNDRIAHMRKQCETSIMGGFSSNAMVAERAFYYDSDRDDQQNLTDAIISLEVNGGTFMIVCNDPETQSGFIEREHTESQAKKVKSDFAAYRLGRSQHLTSKISEINSKTKIDDVNSVNW